MYCSASDSPSSSTIFKSSDKHFDAIRTVFGAFQGLELAHTSILIDSLVVCIRLLAKEFVYSRSVCHPLHFVTFLINTSFGTQVQSAIQELYTSLSHNMAPELTKLHAGALLPANDSHLVRLWHHILLLGRWMNVEGMTIPHPGDFHRRCLPRYWYPAYRGRIVPQACSISREPRLRW